MIRMLRSVGAVLVGYLPFGVMAFAMLTGIWLHGSQGDGPCPTPSR
jgi:hypothetical protein